MSTNVNGPSDDPIAALLEAGRQKLRQEREQSSLRAQAERDKTAAEIRAAWDSVDEMLKSVVPGPLLPFVQSEGKRDRMPERDRLWISMEIPDCAPISFYAARSSLKQPDGYKKGPYEPMRDFSHGEWISVGTYEVASHFDDNLGDYRQSVRRANSYQTDDFEKALALARYYHKQRLVYEQKAAEANAEAERKKKEIESPYCAAYAEYLRLKQEVFARNQAKVEALQAELDVSYTVWKLAFALLGESEDGERQVETDHVYVFSGEPDALGYWPVYDHGEITPRKFYNKVWLEGPIATKPSAGLAHGYTSPGSGLGTIRFHPSLDAQQVRLRLQLEPMPEKPDKPEGLLTSRAERIERNVEAMTSGESE